MLKLTFNNNIIDKNDLKNFVNKNFLNFIFIIDCISTAHIVAIMAKGKRINCIYECKDITWRTTNYIKLYDMILSNVVFNTKKVVKIEHPFSVGGNNFFQRIANQNKFTKEIKNKIILKKNYIYVSSCISSILLGNKNSVKHMLIDEGIGSILPRHSYLFSKYNFKIYEKIKNYLSYKLLPFKFHPLTPQLTLTQDNHRSILLNLDYMSFNSKIIFSKINFFLKKIKKYENKVLVILKGPSPGKNFFPKEGDLLDDVYINFNFLGIKYFNNLMNFKKNTQFYLKQHPSLGKSLSKYDPLIRKLKIENISCLDLNKEFNFEEASSLPAEILLRYCNFNFILALDVTSLLWNILSNNKVKCYLPIVDIINLAKNEDSQHLKIYKYQIKLNDLFGNKVNTFSFNYNKRNNSINYEN